MSQVHVTSAQYGVLPSGTPVTQFQLQHSTGASVSIIEYGAILTNIVMPDRHGALSDVIAGYSTLQGYLDDTMFLGAVVGRYANRIAKGHLVLDGVTYKLPLNNGTNHLHGGPNGYFRALWKGRPFADAEGAGVELTLHSPDGDEGYPGALDVCVRYHLDAKLRLSVDYEARTSKLTVVNLTQHAYFNLAGVGSILDHTLRIHAERFTPTDETAIPTGALEPVAGTAFDFRTARRIGDAIDADDTQIKFGRGYDHNFVVDGAAPQLRLAAELRCATTGRRLCVHTTEPGIQFYSGNYLPNSGEPRPHGLKHGFREALCLETQHFPDSPNQPQFPSTRLEQGQTFKSRTEFAFDVDAES